MSNTVYPNSLKQFLVLAKSQALLGTLKDFIITKVEPCSNYFLELLKFTEHKYISKEKGKWRDTLNSKTVKKIIRKNL